MKSTVVLGIDIGGTKIAAAVVNSEGKIIKEVKENSCCRGLPSFFLPLNSAIGKLLDFSIEKKLSVCGIGLGIAGLVDSKEQKVLFAPNLPIAGLPLKDILQERFELPILVDNDANCAAWGEKKIGAGKDAQDFLCVTLGTGIGGGFVSGGKLYRGAIGCAGEIGHMVIDINGPRCSCGRFGCFEALASAKALERRAAAELPEDSLVLKLVGGDRMRICGEVITEAAKKGDVFARNLLAEIGKIIGTGFSNLINIFDPELIIVGGGLAAASGFVLPVARREVASQVMADKFRVTEIVPAQLGLKAGMIGAAMLARDELCL